MPLLARSSALEVMLLSQVLLEPGELVHDKQVQQAHRVQCAHSKLAHETQAIHHEAYEEQEDAATGKRVHETEVHSDEAGNRLQAKKMAL